MRDRRVLHACGVQGCVNPAHLEVRHKWDRGPYRVVVIDESGPQREHNPLWWDWEREILHLGKDWRTLVSFRFVSGEWERVGTRPELDRRWRGPL